MLSDRNLATGGGVHNGNGNYFYNRRRGWRSMSLCHQMVRRKTVRTTNNLVGA